MWQKWQLMYNNLHIFCWCTYILFFLINYQPFRTSDKSGCTDWGGTADDWQGPGYYRLVFSMKLTDSPDSDYCKTRLLHEMTSFCIQNNVFPLHCHFEIFKIFLIVPIVIIVSAWILYTQNQSHYIEVPREVSPVKKYTIDCKYLAYFKQKIKK